MIISINFQSLHIRTSTSSTGPRGRSTRPYSMRPAFPGTATPTDKPTVGLCFTSRQTGGRRTSRRQRPWSRLRKDRKTEMVDQTICRAAKSVKVANNNNNNRQVTVLSIYKVEKWTNKMAEKMFDKAVSAKIRSTTLRTADATIDSKIGPSN